MNIVYNLLNELKYQTKEPFTFDISSDGDKTPIIVTPFVSVEYPCQIFGQIRPRGNGDHC